MKRSLVIVGLVAALLPSAALAYCPNLPDDAQSHYVDNGTRHLVCLQGELSADTAATARSVQLQQQLTDLQAQIARQQALAQATINLPPGSISQLP